MKEDNHDLTGLADIGKSDNKIRLFLIDDDALFLRLLELEFLEHGDFIIETFTTGESAIANLLHKPDVVILDYFLEGTDGYAMNGLETLDNIKDYNKAIPIVMLSSQDKIYVAVNCMRHGAFDYVVKSETAFMRLQKVLSNIFHHKKPERDLDWYMEKADLHIGNHL